ncbi:MAG TPA: hypothetical protein VFX40_02030 [Gemmatimonadaceae bacterium]|nr:hypothetical protein [Gemmatimonadaceae bacterium]
MRILRIDVESLGVPVARFVGLALCAGYVSQVPEYDRVVRIQLEGFLEHRAGFVGPAGIVESLAVHHMPAHVTGLLGQMSPADRDCLLWVSCFPVFVGERGEIAPRILVEFLP